MSVEYTGYTCYAYKNFCIEISEKIKHDNPNSSIGHRCNIIQNLWESMSLEKKMSYLSKEMQEEKLYNEKKTFFNINGEELYLYEETKEKEIQYKKMMQDEYLEYDTPDEYMEALENPKNFKNVKKIFINFINICGNELTKEIMKKFIKKGLDINIKSKKFCNGENITALESCCEFRAENAIKVLLESGAKLQKNCVEKIMQGHSYNCYFNTQTCETALKEIEPFLQGKYKVKKYILEESELDTEYIKNFLQTYVVIID